MAWGLQGYIRGPQGVAGAGSASADPTAEDYGYGVWTLPPSYVRSSYGPEWGVLVGSRIKVPVTQSFELVQYVIDFAGYDLVTGQNFIGVYDSTGDLVVSTADATDAWGVTGVQQSDIALTELAAGSYDVCFLVNATDSSPSLTAFAPDFPAGWGASGVMMGFTAGSGLTSLPSSLPTKTLIPEHIWVALS